MVGPGLKNPLEIKKFEGVQDDDRAHRRTGQFNRGRPVELDQQSGRGQRRGVITYDQGPLQICALGRLDLREAGYDRNEIYELSLMTQTRDGVVL